MRTARWVALPAALAISLAVAACGGSSGSSSAAPPSPAALSKDVQSAVQQAKSVHINGTVNQNGKQLHLDLNLTRDRQVFGQLSVSGAAFTVLSTQGSTYIKVTGRFLRYLKLPPAACSLMCGKFLKATPDQSQSLVGDLSMANMFSSLHTTKPDFTYGGTATVNGQQAWVLHSAKGSTAYVASQGTHYPLRIVGPHHQGQVDFSQWNSAKIPAPPPANQVVDLSQLQH